MGRNLYVLGFLTGSNDGTENANCNATKILEENAIDGKYFNLALYISRMTFLLNEPRLKLSCERKTTSTVASRDHLVVSLHSGLWGLAMGWQKNPRGQSARAP